MTKIALYFPANASHSFLIENRWQRMYDEQLGLHAIGRSGLPVTTSHQGMDYILFPFLRPVLEQYPNIAISNASFGHPLLPLVDERHQKWETHRRIGNLPVTFFSEFYTPESHFIPTEFFFHLSPQTTQYSMRFGVVAEDPVVGTPLPKDAISVLIQNRIGIIVDDFGNFTRAWFAFGAVPTAENLDAVMKEIERLTEGTRRYCVVPIDLEQPWVGSTLGASMFDRFFDELKRRGLDQHIVPMQEVMNAAREYPVPIPQPHRILTKWSSHFIQLKYLQRIAKLKPKTEREHVLYTLATGSDLLSSWNRYVQRSQGPANILKCQTLQGEAIEMPQGHNEPLQLMSLAACNALEHPDQQSFANRLADLPVHNGLTRRVQEWAAQHNF